MIGLFFWPYGKDEYGACFFFFLWSLFWVLDVVLMCGEDKVGDFEEVSDNRRFCVVVWLMLFSGLGELGGRGSVFESLISYVCIESLVSIFWLGSMMLDSLGLEQERGIISLVVSLDIIKWSVEVFGSDFR